MAKENVLNELYFIRLCETAEESAAFKTPAYAGQVLGEVADGWFLIAVMDHNFRHIDYKLVPVGDLQNCTFYPFEPKFRDDYRKFNPVELSRLPPLEKRSDNAA